MISTKIGTQNWSKSVQNHDFGEHDVHYSAAKTDPTKSESGPKSKGEQSVGDVLNMVANPGGDASKIKRKAHNTLDKDDFLKLMLTQMKNQDPMNPMQSHEMAAQLAQFTSLEQLFNVNKNLEGLAKGQDPMQKYEALNFLGKTIKADSRQIVRQTGDQGSELRFNLMADASKIKLTIADEMGTPVKTIEYGGLKAGTNKLSWAGTDDMDREVKPGKYIFTVEAEGNGGKKIGVLTETHGTITGVNYTPEGPMLMVGDQKVRLQDVQKIEDENLKLKQNELEGAAPVALPNADAAGAGDGSVTDVKGGSANTGGQRNALASGQAHTMASSSVTSAKPKLKEETKDAKPLGAIMPIEVAMGQGGSTAPVINRPKFRSKGF